MMMMRRRCNHRPLPLWPWTTTTTTTTRLATIRTCCFLLILAPQCCFLSMVHSSLIGPRQQQHPQPKNIAKNGEEKESVLKQQQQQKQQQLKVSFVTGNSMKVNEVQRILSEHGATKGPTPGQSLVDLQIVKVDLPEIQEVDTIAIAKDKVLLAAQLAGGPCLVEDTSLQFTALGGMPGPYIKWFQDRLQCHGLYNILAAYQDKSATAVCTLAFCPAPHSDPVLFTGTCQGTIVAPVEGRGFGWDSIFVPTTKTGEMHHVPFSQMSIEEKNIYSHRGKAVRKWADWIGHNRDALWHRQEGTTYLPGHKGLDFRVEYSEQ